jgi:drug/metabolite transporter superfamily protein YnfA
LLLFLYGVVPTLQPAHFGRVYAAYGGVFVVLSLFWGWWIDGRMPDRADVVGGLLVRPELQRIVPRFRGQDLGGRDMKRVERAPPAATPECR